MLRLEAPTCLSPVNWGMKEIKLDLVHWTITAPCHVYSVQVFVHMLPIKDWASTNGVWNSFNDQVFCVTYRLLAASQHFQPSLLLQAAWTRSQSKIFCCSFIWNHKTWVGTWKVSQKEKQSFCSELCLELIDPQDNNTQAFKSAIHHHFLIIYIFLNFVWDDDQWVP